jgi:hypothetical protein
MLDQVEVLPAWLEIQCERWLDLPRHFGEIHESRSRIREEVGNQSLLAAPLTEQRADRLAGQPHRRMKGTYRLPRMVEEIRPGAESRGETSKPDREIENDLDFLLTRAGYLVRLHLLLKTHE